jgi:hypothetical protein
MFLLVLALSGTHLNGACKSASLIYIKFFRAAFFWYEIHYGMAACAVAPRSGIDASGPNLIHINQMAMAAQVDCPALWRRGDCHAQPVFSRCQTCPIPPAA